MHVSAGGHSHEKKKGSAIILSFCLNVDEVFS